MECYKSLWKGTCFNSQLNQNKNETVLPLLTTAISIRCCYLLWSSAVADLDQRLTRMSTKQAKISIDIPN